MGIYNLPFQKSLTIKELLFFISDVGGKMHFHNKF